MTKAANDGGNSRSGKALPRPGKQPKKVSLPGKAPALKQKKSGGK